MKRWSLLFLVVGLLVGVVAGLLLDQGVSAQGPRVQGTVMYLTNGSLSSVTIDRGRTVAGQPVAYCFTGGGNTFHCVPAR